MFAYGVHINNLGMAAMYALLFLIASILPFSLIWIILLWMALYKYFYEVLINTARGQLQPPEISIRQTNDYMAWKSLGLVVVMVAISISAWTMGNPVFGGIIAAFFMLALPASIMALAMTESVFAALNPLMLTSVMSRVGSPYFLLFVFEMMLVMSSVSLRSMVGPFLPDYIGLMVLQILDNVFLIIMFHLIGYVMYQYHYELGLELDEHHTRALDEPPEDPVMARIHNLIQEGQVDEAKKILGDLLLQQGGTPELHEQYRKLLRLASDDQNLLSHGKTFITVLLALEDPNRALQITAECFNIDKAFTFADPVQIHELASYALKTGQIQLALSLTNGFGKKYPKHKDVLPNYLLAARVLSERMNQDAKAIAILQQLVKKFPDHPDVEQAQQLLEVLQNLMGKK